jgi:hypothetical protein
MIKKSYFCVLGRKQSNCSKSFFFVLFVSFLLCSSYLSAADTGQNSRAEQSYDTSRFKCVSLTHISAEKGIQYLSELKLGTVSQIRGTNVLLVTGQQHELDKAVAILKLVDAKEQYIVRALFPASKVKNMPSNEQIATKVGGIAIGNFSSPPTDVAGSGTSSSLSTKAIIDVHNNMLVVVAPVRRLQQIVSAIESAMGGQSWTQGSMARHEQGMVETRQAPLELSNNGRAIDSGFSLLTGQADSHRLGSVNGSAVGELSPSPLSFLGSEPVSAQTGTTRALSYEPEPIPNGEDVLSETLPEKPDIVYLLGLAGAYLNLDFVYDPEKVQGEVTLMLQGKLRGPIKVKDSKAL